MFDAVLGFFGAFFILGSFWFWVVFAAMFAGLVALADHEENFWAGAVVGLFILAVFQFNDLSVNWSLVPWILLGYLVLGVVMSFIKWISYLKLRADKYVSLKLNFYQRYKKQYDLPTIVDNTNMRHELEADTYDKFVRYLKDDRFLSHKDKSIIPQWKDKVGKLVSWTLWWPAVIFWTFLNDPLRRLAVSIVTSLRGYYENIASRVFGNVGVTNEDNEDLYGR